MLNYIFCKNFPSNWQQIILILSKLHSFNNFYTLFCSLCIRNETVKKEKNSKPLIKLKIFFGRTTTLALRVLYINLSGTRACTAVSRLKGFSRLVCSVRNIIRNRIFALIFILKFIFPNFSV